MTTNFRNTQQLPNDTPRHVIDVNINDRLLAHGILDPSSDMCIVPWRDKYHLNLDDSKAIGFTKIKTAEGCESIGWVYEVDLELPASPQSVKFYDVKVVLAEVSEIIIGQEGVLAEIDYIVDEENQIVIFRQSNKSSEE